MKKIISFLMIVLFFASIGQAYAVTTNNNPIRERDFNATIGIGTNDEAQIFLNGNYHIRWRTLIVYGTTTNGEQQVRFQGLFRGSYFILQIPLRGRIINIFGRYIVDENHDFSGRWIARGIGVNGWIRGSLN
jgi:hypothetical protein